MSPAALDGPGADLDSDPSLPVLFDIDGDSRDPDAPDIGADEVPDLRQTHTRWRNDDESEVLATWAAAEDTALAGSKVRPESRSFASSSLRAASISGSPWPIKSEWVNSGNTRKGAAPSGMSGSKLFARSMIRPRGSN